MATLWRKIHGAKQVGSEKKEVKDWKMWGTKPTLFKIK
jgi:hypothetical protein